MVREATVERQTKETKIDVALRLEGRSRVDVSTGIGMLDHMIEQLGRHGGLDLKVHAQGDLHVDAHHTVEDIGLALGKALNDALGDRAGIARMADRTVPLDESLVHAALDLSGRPYTAIDLRFSAGMAGELPTPLVPHFFESFAQEGRFALHLRQLAGDNDHHIMEAAFKATARALRDAVLIVDPAGVVPSTKGTLTA
ncbi:MAG: imidazoleglycerol-phosphate dehydratase [Chloroflexi bacterium]|nr:MAG: imidazoleglycerol-phosphate dehydratase [Chloroflexota bacterium]